MKGKKLSGQGDDRADRRRRPAAAPRSAGSCSSGRSARRPRASPRRLRRPRRRSSRRRRPSSRRSLPPRIEQPEIETADLVQPGEGDAVDRRPARPAARARPGRTRRRHRRSRPSRSAGGLRRDRRLQHRRHQPDVHRRLLFDHRHALPAAQSRHACATAQLQTVGQAVLRRTRSASRPPANGQLERARHRQRLRLRRATAAHPPRTGDADRDRHRHHSTATTPAPSSDVAPGP